jgi:hypothetical protein
METLSKLEGLGSNRIAAGGKFAAAGAVEHDNWPGPACLPG